MIRVQEASFRAGEELERFSAAQSGAGAITSFSGIVRDLPQGGLDRMEIEHYPGMTEKALHEIATQARVRWDLTGSLIIHRYGVLRPGEIIMMVATAAPHRAAAFSAAEFLMDYLKSRAPFWKKEYGADGAEWVAAKACDEAALTRW